MIKLKEKNLFWEYFEEEVLRAEQLEMPIIVQPDSNAQLGIKLILDDPNHEPNQNGGLMKQFLDRTNLIVVNALDICKGVITRTRKTVLCAEEAVLDFSLVCRKIKPFLTKMVVDEIGDTKRSRARVPIGGQ